MRRTPSLADLTQALSLAKPDFRAKAEAATMSPVAASRLHLPPSVLTRQRNGSCSSVGSSVCDSSSDCSVQGKPLLSPVTASQPHTDATLQPYQAVRAGDEARDGRIGLGRGADAPVYIRPDATDSKSDAELMPPPPVPYPTGRSRPSLASFGRSVSMNVAGRADPVQRSSAATLRNRTSMPSLPKITLPKGPHPLEHSWTLYSDSPSERAAAGQERRASGTTQSFEAGLRKIGTFDTIESFAQHFNWLKPPSKLSIDSNVYLFKNDIKPQWEDASNSQGGKFIIRPAGSNLGLLDIVWRDIALACVGEMLDGEANLICGAIVSLRGAPAGHRVQVWVRDRHKSQELDTVRHGINAALNCHQQVVIAFMPHKTSGHAAPSKLDGSPAHAKSNKMRAVSSPTANGRVALGSLAPNRLQEQAVQRRASSDRTTQHAPRSPRQQSSLR
ncbi:uncharacterized protein L969DRAFT_94472 [Mixia osmundae IAM 14324]|uniref:Translation initiation factor eIF4e n=1 Tax=Mixia osmundae (strain CBS 9802 / IAM 14324 / JCM 22182 / KY 12970) TaxID=764103 RepID=G7E3K8_MIXOS|nr:uncharacterized protein L969DRAFT_94472 [Mixia osmundae IAM 14324]KEI39404.1 hypothetical protein L969DRAFT_94472 [Mixia osmundae IAM 14324]GAA97418.1 hypothetical protein E5Q_04096 [Mixia osmundae IAM 14324]